MMPLEVFFFEFYFMEDSECSATQPVFWGGGAAPKWLLRVLHPLNTNIVDS